MSIIANMSMQNGTSGGNQLKRTLALARKQGMLRTRDVVEAGIPRVALTRLVEQGQLTRLGRGLYALPNLEITEHHVLAEVAKRVPNGVVCLLSALRFHGMTTEAPFETWIALESNARRPQVAELPLRVVRFSGAASTFGIDRHRVERVVVRVTSPAKTVADCFKFRNKIGVDVALAALRDYRKAKHSREKLWKAAEVCRVLSVMRPYMEAVA